MHACILDLSFSFIINPEEYYMASIFLLSAIYELVRLSLFIESFSYSIFLLSAMSLVIESVRPDTPLHSMKHLM